ncbi:MAG: hypothetical protein LBK50_03120 [Candidatus Nomurabacteria bacterium]|jgi:hypothetical protein|nr:hypothetical protein [Candidatus Nomurabacteria bacterium]
MAYKHTNSKGKTYTLYYKDVILRGGKEQRIYFFAVDSDKGTPTDLPEGKTVAENKRNGFLVIKNK